MAFGQTTLYFSSKNVNNPLPNRSVNSDSRGSIELSYAFNSGEMNKIERKSTTFDIINIKGFGKTLEAGKPALPAHNDLLLLSSAKQPTIKITAAEYIEYTGYNIFPAQPEARDTYGAKQPEFTLDSATYATNAFYPKDIVHCENIMLSRGNPIGVLQIRPVQYNPVTKTIRVYSKIAYRIEQEPNRNRAAQFAGNSKTYQKTLKSMVLNHWDVPEVQVPRADQTGFNYIIIAPTAYKQAADTLAQWKRQMGYSVDVVLQDTWTYNQVKDAVHDRYEEWDIKPDYVTIIGDHDGEYAVPGRVLLATNNENKYASDLHIVCIDSYSDYHPDMAKGRISVNSPAQALRVVQKIVNYERTPVNNPSFYKKGTNCAQFQDVEDDEDADGYACRRFLHTSENIRDYLKNEQNYEVDRIYSAYSNVNPTNYNQYYYSNGESLPDELLRDNGFEWNGNSLDIKNAINDGRFYLFHRDHGYSGGIGWSMPHFVSNGASGGSDIEQLSNGNLLPVIFSINCHTGEFSLPNCFAEEFLRKDNGGAVGVVAAACYSLSGYNDGFSIGMVDAIWSNPGLTAQFGYGGIDNPEESVDANTNVMGDVVNLGLNRMIETWGDHKYTHRLFHWFGEAAMRMWTSDPYDSLLTATHRDTLYCNETEFELTGIPFTGGIATLVAGNKLIGKAVIENETVNIPYSLDLSYQTVTLTLTGKNQHPYMVELPISQSCAYIPTVVSQPTNNISNVSIELKGEVIRENNSEVIEKGFYYSTNPECNPEDENTVKVIDNTESALITYTIEGLEANTMYYYMAWATNAEGTGLGKIQSIETLCAPMISEFPFKLKMPENAFAECWTTIDNNENDKVWISATSSDRKFKSTTAEDGYFLFDSDEYGGSKKYDADLISHVFDFSNEQTVYLNFEQAYKNLNGKDSIALYISYDNGTNWEQLERWTDDIGTLDEPNFYYRDITALVAGKKNIRFKWNYIGAWCYYWCIDDINIGPKPMTSIEESNFSNEINIYPNPANEYFIIDNKAGVCIESVKMYTVNGQQVLSEEKPTGNTIKINTKILEQGVYFIRVNSANSFVYKKIVIE
jgi:hypothetical protein